MIIEWNAHMFSSDTTRYPFHPNAAYTPNASHWEADPLAAYLQRLQEEHIDRAILVHPEPYGDDHSLVLDCLQREPNLFRGTSLFYPKDPDAPQKLVDLVAQEPKIIATRFHAHRGKEQYLDSFTDRNVHALWEKAIELGLIVELHIGPDYGAQVRDILKDFPQTVTLIDHLAEPHKGDAVEFANILDLAQFENVYMKLSGLNHFAKDEPHYESAKPFTKIVAETFGPDRLVWSSGSPKNVDVHLPQWSEADRAKVKGENLKQLLWPNG
ncbi:MAG: amidohydrolase [Candidatus Latescibacteria bacterium]|nr:amidohydrolase [Candidatus Latescibacterota bacterium]